VTSAGNHLKSVSRSCLFGKAGFVEVLKYFLDGSPGHIVELDLLGNTTWPNQGLVGILSG